MLKLYCVLMSRSGPLLRRLLTRRLSAGKEDAARMLERIGQPSRARPEGALIWIHAASVGEAQSTLKLIAMLLLRDPSLNILVTSGTVNSARLLEQRLPRHAFHQFYPLDHPAWVGNFLDHWRPDLILWMESELWPVMLSAVRARRIPAALLNARLSARSARRWKLARNAARDVLSAFDIVLAQTEGDKNRFEFLGARDVRAVDNLKYGAEALPCDADMLAQHQTWLEGRTAWVYASTHEGEEALACRVHGRLLPLFPDLLTVIVPRHPERGAQISASCRKNGQGVQLRSIEMKPKAGIYIADTLGELGLFYRLCPVACIGRSFSDDGGGGHNPIEAALLGCAVLHGPYVQNLKPIYDEMDEHGAAIHVEDEDALARTLQTLLGDPAMLADRQRRSLQFVAERGRAVDEILETLEPLLGRLPRVAQGRAA